MLRMANRHLFSSEFESGRAHLSMIMEILPKRRLTSLRDLDSISKRDSLVGGIFRGEERSNTEKKKFFIDRKAEAKKQSVEDSYPEMY